MTMTHPNEGYPVAIMADFNKGPAMEVVQACLPEGDPDDLLQVPRYVVEAFVVYAQMKLSEASIYADAYMKQRMGRAEFDENIEPKLAEMCNTAQDAALVNSPRDTAQAVA